MDCIRTVFKKRKGPNRKYILLFLVIAILSSLSSSGVKDLFQPYLRTKFEWYHPQITQYTSISAIIAMVGLGIFVPIIKISKASDSLVMAILCTSGTGAWFLFGLATETWMLYIGKCQWTPGMCVYSSISRDIFEHWVTPGLHAILNKTKAGASRC